MALDEYLRGEDERQLLQKKMQAEGRLPPGQSATIKWPVLHTGAVPEFDPAAAGAVAALLAGGGVLIARRRNRRP
jgi:LPXTG-motif cell wall-anchored protein